MKVLAFTKYGPSGASSRVRLYQYIPLLAKEGITIEVAPLFGDRYIRDLYYYHKRRPVVVVRSFIKRLLDLLRLLSFDLVWIEKELFPYCPPWIESFLSTIGVPYVVDYDDAIFHNYDLNPRKALRLFLHDKIDKVMRNAKVVFAGNRYLAERAANAGAERIEIIPSVVDVERYQLKKRVYSDTLVVGWIGTPMSAKYLELVREPLCRLAQDINLRVVLVGSGPVDLPGVPLVVQQWSILTEDVQIRQFDVGIMPLLDAPGERGKCGYKLIQYMACGLPVVASPVGVNTEIVEEGVNGFLARTQAEWYHAIYKLAQRPELREQMGARGRRKVEQFYSLQVMAPKLVKILRSVKN